MVDSSSYVWGIVKFSEFLCNVFNFSLKPPLQTLKQAQMCLSTPSHLRLLLQNSRLISEQNSGLLRLVRRIRAEWPGYSGPHPSRVPSYKVAAGHMAGLALKVEFLSSLFKMQSARSRIFNMMNRSHLRVHKSWCVKWMKSDCMCVGAENAKT